jgi:hypothetical protein
VRMRFALLVLVRFDLRFGGGEGDRILCEKREYEMDISRG